MKTWTDYKEHVRETNPEIGKDIDEMEAVARIVGAMIERRHELNLSQRDLALLCDIPHSTVARIESGKTVPNLNTLLKVFRYLDINLVVEKSIDVL
ncbi:MAG TPA: helix-turn-helix transcriptional regulator [Clostridia bacterium]|jgi:predicted transcriptional regulator|nr:helix-turn-helix transcriptional regulator [Clostridia bacterium]